MKIHCKKDKINIIITSAALVSVAASAAYTIWQKKTVKEKVLNAEADTIWRLSRIYKQRFPKPDETDFEKMNGKSCSGIAHQIDKNTYSDNDYGNLSRDYAVLILNGIAQNMKEGETLSEFLERKESED